VASGAGYSVLGSFREVAPNYPFVCFGVNTDWLASKAEVARRFAHAWFKGVAWLYDPANRAEAEALLAQGLKVSADAAARTYESLIVQNKNTFSRDGKIDPEALRNIVTVMVEGEELPAMPKGDLSKYLDETMVGASR
jgi:ABC-type nitrate/sulfonate/bicarbonate transport system substrate-binding protein